MTNIDGITIQAVPDCLDFETKLKHILGDLLPEKVRSLPADCELNINVAYYEYQDAPGGWNLESGTLRKLADLACDLNIDLYMSGPPLPD